MLQSVSQTIPSPASPDQSAASVALRVATNALQQSGIAVIIPCFNEATAIPHVIRDFRLALPTARIYVFDNNSSDATGEVARAAGAAVRRETQQGKGQVIRRAFADIEADIFVLVDGDDTYDAAAAPQMVQMLTDERLDMVTGARGGSLQGAYRPGHRFGNRVLTGLVQTVFGDRVSDVMSGYRVFSRRFVKSFPAQAVGFETETEFTVHALALRLPVGELTTTYRARAPGSFSKLRTISDGIRILRTILVLMKEERPLPFFSIAGGLILLVACGLAMPVLVEYSRTGLVPRLPTAILSMGLTLISVLSFSCGMILDSVARGRREIKWLAYLAARSA